MEDPSINPQYINLLASIINGEENGTSVLESRLAKLREKMTNYGIDAYIVMSEGDHQEEYPAAADLRRSYLSGFTGSAGDAVVTMKQALLWTDSRYYIQAEEQLGPSWTLVMKEPQVDPMEVWLRKNLEKDQKVGVDPKTITFENWNQIDSHLSSKLIKFIPLENNLIDEIWEDRPSYPSDPVYIHDCNFSGEEYTKKIKRVREKLASLEADLCVVSALDEVAWLLNLRGNDISMTPVFISYVLLTPKWATLYTRKEIINSSIIEYLSNPLSQVSVKPYTDFWKDLQNAIKEAKKVLLPSGKRGGTSYAIYSRVPKEKLLNITSPIMDMKSSKNRIEVQGSRNAHLRDAVALCELFHLLENQVPNEIYWDELKVVYKLQKLRSEQKWNKGSSFNAIVAFGKNGALPHYKPTKETNLKLDTEGLLTIDSGGQYLDGTIDTTRVLHFGKPSAMYKTIYTSLLKGVADLATTIFPDGTKVSDLEFIIRRPLLQLGMTFGHGTTHGTGVFLGVHEAFNGTYHHHFIGSQEPGYYRKGEFGMRLENLIVVEDAPVKDMDNSQKLFKFSPLTLVPYEPNLIDVSNMDKSQINWLNEYHEQVRLHVGTEMVKQGKSDLYQWLVKKTTPLAYNTE
ncbi:xaa-Pro aminopeptidase ApepP-like isoform X2 [Cimex lectularius]|uniref:Uncharacterized protein n=1 Tax=Cimex lectularius TaxID=79782 RepID=A0A8I6R6X2_CIMLE|nr:xaa-Pro aminopeptidase ApepP-like isoform X2 [Cimex lectularius]